MSAAPPRVSVVIPTKNAGPRFERTLQAISRQDLGEPFEILIIDSGSTDDTLNISQAHGAQIMRIAPRAFGHGRTRNQAVAACRSPYVALTVQDAAPADEHWLSSLVAALDSDPGVAGAYSRTMAHDGASLLARQATEYWFKLQGHRVEQRISDEPAFARLPFESKQMQCTFNNVSSIVRRAVWQEHPFRDIRFAEDLAWGYDVLRAGYALVYEPASQVRHSHERTLWYELRRAYVDAQVIGELFGEPAAPLSLAQLAAMAGLAVRVTRPPTALHDMANRSPEELLAYAETTLRALYRSDFDCAAIVCIFGGCSPYSPQTRADLVEQLNRRWEVTHPQEDDFGAYDISESAQGGYRRYRRLDKRISEAAWAGDPRALNSEDLDFIFGSLWDEIGRDYVRQAVLDKIATAGQGTLADVEFRTHHFVASLVEAATQEGSLTEALYGDILRHATAIVMGRRLGAANRYGSGGRWGWVLDRWFARGI